MPRRSVAIMHSPIEDVLGCGAGKAKNGKRREVKLIVRCEV
jgi:hypothetical protein